MQALSCHSEIRDVYSAAFVAWCFGVWMSGDHV